MLAGLFVCLFVCLLVCLFVSLLDVVDCDIVHPLGDFACLLVLLACLLACLNCWLFDKVLVFKLRLPYTFATGCVHLSALVFVVLSLI